jgi:hypothetical protein
MAPTLARDNPILAESKPRPFRECGSAAHKLNISSIIILHRARREYNAIVRQVVLPIVFLGPESDFDKIEIG